MSAGYNSETQSIPGAARQYPMALIQYNANIKYRFNKMWIFHWVLDICISGRHPKELCMNSVMQSDGNSLRIDTFREASTSALMVS